MFCFPVITTTTLLHLHYMESSFCFANVEFITVSTTSFIDELGPLRSAQAIFVWKIRFDVACVLEYDLEIDERVEIVCAGFLLPSMSNTPKLSRFV